MGNENMRELKKYKLNFELARNYINENLDQTNRFSIAILETQDFKNGSFFTLLPPEANLKQIYSFSQGGILPQYPDQEHYTNGIKSVYSLIPSIDNELATLIFEEIKSHNNLSCIFDDVSSSTNESKGFSLFDNYGLSFEDESYYLLKKNSITVSLIKNCLKVSNAFWHSLCIITKADCDYNKRLLISEEVNEICAKAELIMVCAYDREGYVFWEKSMDNSGNGFFVEKSTNCKKDEN